MRRNNDFGILWLLSFNEIEELMSYLQEEKSIGLVSCSDLIFFTVHQNEL